MVGEGEHASGATVFFVLRDDGCDGEGACAGALAVGEYVEA